jgi:iron(II)-dependent oxidoreductase
VMFHDRMLFDRDTNQWTVDRYLDDLVDRYGGIDAVLLWQGYPNLGADDQNNFDMLRNLPGGMPALQRLVSNFQARGVRVLFPNFVWDFQTREEGPPQYESLVGLVIEAGADGINGDTMDGLDVNW